MKIHLVFINGSLPDYRHRLAADLQRHLPATFTFKHWRESLQRFYHRQRRQYYSTEILAALQRHLPNKTDKVLGIVGEDIFIPILTFLFGEAQLNGPAALISTYRLRNEFYGLPPDDTLLYERILKEALHELGHTFGLVHCPDYRCVMHASTYVEDSDLKEAQFCLKCRQQLTE